MSSFIDLRKMVHALAEHYVSDLSVPNGEFRKRCRVIEKTLSKTHFEDVPGEVWKVPAYFAPEFGSLRSEWNNISLTDTQLKRVEAELEAAWALIWAWSDIVYDFGERSEQNLLDDLFGRDMNFEREMDARKWRELEEQARQAERWPVVGMMGVMAFAIAIGDTAAGNDGTATGIFGIGGIGAIGYAAFMWNSVRQLYTRKHEIWKKWNGPPTRILPSEQFKNF